MTNPLKLAFPVASPATRATTLANLASALALPLADSTAVAAFHALNLAADGTPYAAVIYNGNVYAYDADDGTTAHDPDAGCITTADSRRYIRSVAVKPEWSVLDKDLTEPPGSPSEGDSYYVATAATGAWSGRDGDVAVYGARGWTFRTVSEGHILYVEDEEVYYHMTSGGSLQLGLGDLGLGAASVNLVNLESPFGAVVEAEQAAPPGSPSGRIKYIVAASGSGAWSTKDTQVAEWTGSAWSFHVPKEGDFLYDKTLGVIRKYNGAAWVNAVEEQPRLDVKLLHYEAVNFDNSGAGWVFPAVYATHEIELASWTITGEAGQRVVLDLYDILIEARKDSGAPGFGAGCYMKIQKDSEVTNIYYESVTPATLSTGSYTVFKSGFANTSRLINTIGDGSAHTYRLKIYLVAGGAFTLGDVRLTLSGERYRFVGTVEDGS